MRIILMFLAITLVGTNVFGQEIKIKKKKGKYGLVRDKVRLTNFEFDEIKKTFKGDWVVRKEEKWGYANEEGKYVIKCVYDTLKRELADQLEGKLNGKYGMLNTDGSLFLAFEYDKIDYCQDSICLVKLEQRWGNYNLRTNEMDYNPSNLVFRTPELMPYYNGDMTPQASRKDSLNTGVNNLLHYLYENIEYPTEARDNGISGTVVISFVVDETGKLSDFEILREIGKGCGAEVIRVAKLIESFEPGQQNGRAVKTRFILPCRFKLN